MVSSMFHLVARSRFLKPRLNYELRILSALEVCLMVGADVCVIMTSRSFAGYRRECVQPKGPS